MFLCLKYIFIFIVIDQSSPSNISSVFWSSSPTRSVSFVLKRKPKRFGTRGLMMTFYSTCLRGFILLETRRWSQKWKRCPIFNIVQIQMQCSLPLGAFMKHLSRILSFAKQQHGEYQMDPTSITCSLVLPNINTLMIFVFIHINKVSPRLNA